MFWTIDFPMSWNPKPSVLNSWSLVLQYLFLFYKFQIKYKLIQYTSTLPHWQTCLHNAFVFNLKLRIRIVIVGLWPWCLYELFNMDIFSSTWFAAQQFFFTNFWKLFLVFGPSVCPQAHNVTNSEHTSKHNSTTSRGR